MDNSIAQPWIVEEVEKLEERIRKMELAGGLMSIELSRQEFSIGRPMWLKIEPPKTGRIAL